MVQQPDGHGTSGTGGHSLPDRIETGRAAGIGAEMPPARPAKCIQPRRTFQKAVKPSGTPVTSRR
jgi:hypothetical protein